MTYDVYSSELVLVSAPAVETLPNEVARLSAFLEQAPDVPLQDVAWTCARAYAPGRAVLSVVAASTAELRQRLASAAKRLSSAPERIRDKTGTYFFRTPTVGKLAFIFPGAGSFYPDMLKELALRYPACRSAFDELEEALAGQAGPFVPSSFIFPPAPVYRHDADVFEAGGYAEAMVSVYAADAALARLLAALGIKPDVVTGAIGGDFPALALAGAFGAFPRPKRLDFLRELYALVSDCAGEVMEGAEARVFDPARCEKRLPRFRKFAARWVSKPTDRPVYSCVAAAPFPEKVRKAREAEAEQWIRPIHLAETIDRMYEDGVRIFVEAGPRSLATAAADEILRGRDHVAIAVNKLHRSGLVQFQHAVGLLAALGRPIAPEALFTGRTVHLLDFDTPLSFAVMADAPERLDREFPQLVPDGTVELPPALPAHVGRGKARAMAAAARERRQRQLDFGMRFPLVADAAEAPGLLQVPGRLREVVKVFTLADFPFLADMALGSSQLSYSKPALKGLTLFPLLVGAEAMAELASELVPNRSAAALENLQSSRQVAFKDGRLALRLRAERIPADDPEDAVVKVSIYEDSDVWDPKYMAFMSVEVVFARERPAPVAFVPETLHNPRSVHWTERDIYPARLPAGALLRHVRQADLWSPEGLDYCVEVPPPAGAVAHTPFPLWIINPVLLSAVADGFSLWRNRERFTGAFAFAFRLQHLGIHTPGFTERTALSCYLRFRGVTEKSHISDIFVSDGNGNLLLEMRGWEELTERVPEEYSQLVLAPASAYLTKSLSPALLGDPATAVATAFVSDVPYKIFSRNEELWLKIVSSIVLDEGERRAFSEMTGATNRRTEWLFGRLAAKEAVRRFLTACYQARWADADVRIWADDAGKPHPLGAWRDFLNTGFDLAISHTQDLIVAVVAAHARVGVDVEKVDRELSDEFTRGVFSDVELELAATSLNAHEALVRFWCAKETVSKALGTGIRYSPKELVITGFQPETGALEVALTGAWLEAFKMFTGRTVHVSSCLVSEHVMASCFIPESFFS